MLAAHQVFDVLTLPESKRHQNPVVGHVAAVIQRRRLTEFQHHVIAAVHDQVNRAHSGQGQAALHLYGRGAVSDAADGAGREMIRAEAQLSAGVALQGDGAGRQGHLDLALAVGGQPLRRLFQLQLEERGQIAGHTQHAQGVGTVGGDFDVQHAVGGPQVGQGRADFGRTCRKQQQPGAALADAEFLGAGGHAPRLHPLQAADAVFGVAQLGAGHDQRQHRSGGQAHGVGRSAGNRLLAVRAGVERELGQLRAGHGGGLGDGDQQHASGRGGGGVNAF